MPNKYNLLLSVMLFVSVLQNNTFQKNSILFTVLVVSVLFICLFVYFFREVEDIDNEKLRIDVW